MYDPNLGRFLSADLIVQSPYNPQSYNRYSYTFNNPGSFTDPTGYGCTTHYFHTYSTLGNVRTGYLGDTTQQTCDGIDFYNKPEYNNGIENFQLPELKLSDYSWPSGPPLGVDGAVASQYAVCGMDTNCMMNIATTEAKGMALVVGGEGAIIAKVGLELRAAKIAADKAAKALIAVKLTQNKMFKNAVSQYKDTALTNAGRALSKHPEVIGQTKDTLRQTLRSDSNLNQAAADALKNIMRNGVRSESNLPRYGDTVTYQIPGGFGARFEAATNKFIGFINP